MENVLVIGVGFMGGSFALALKNHGFKGRIYGYDINPESIRKAIDLGVIDEGTTTLSDIKNYRLDLIMLSTPVRTFRYIAEELKGLVDEEVIITDQGSVKGNIVYELEKILGNRYVGGHPIAGTEKSGVEYSIPNLYEGKKVILTPTENTDKEKLKKVEFTWKMIGGIVEYMSPELHDYVFGVVSHLPHAVAFALVDTLIRMSTSQVDLFKYPGGGFKDFTRIAKSDPVMWRDIFLENKENVLKAIEGFQNSLNYLRELIEEEKEEALTEYLREVKMKRMEID
ncbi:MAG: prephenate dehydrogenase/arogenate dehydrogenase family protein [Aquifex sp.]|nr:MAG: prephenate dehydrogenase/arogenate dehydrogenase family protein [Aquifex sp.]